MQIRSTLRKLMKKNTNLYYKMKNIFKNLGINKKFTISLFLLVVSPLVLTFGFVNQNIMKQITKDSCQKNLEILKQTESSITYMVKDLYYVSQEILGNTNLQGLISKSREIQDTSQAKIDVRYSIQALLDSRDYITRVSIFNKEGILFQFGSFLEEEKDSYGDTLDGLKGSPFWLPAKVNEHYIYQRDRVYETAMLRAINDVYKYNNVLAYERINVSEEYLASLYQGIATDGTKNIVVTDESGQVVSSLDKTLLGSNISGESYFKRAIGVSEGYFLMGKEELVSFYRISDPSWIVFKIDDKNSILNVNIINSIIIFSILLIILFCVFFLQVQKRMIIYPVQALSGEVKKFRDGQYLIKQHTTSKDEIGELNACFVEMGAYIQDLVERELKSKIREKEAQLMSLHSQINPHFLYNTLDAIRWMAVKEKQKDIAVQIEALSNLFRHALNEGKEMTTVGEEIRNLQDYIVIQKNRFGEKLDISIHAEEELYSHAILNLILQPLVENAMIHGLEKKIGPGKIWVVIEKKNNHIFIMVRDNGLGTEEEVIWNKLSNQNEHHDIFALDNVNQRIKYKYGSEYGIWFHSQIGVGTVVEIEIPDVE